MPLGMKDLAVEVQAVHTHLVLPLPTSWSNTLVTQHPPKSAHVSGGLIAVICLCPAIKDAEEVVVSACDDFTMQRVKANS